MEILSNLTWVAVAVILWAVWMGQRRRARGQSLLPGVGVQLIALAMLTVVLLPAISLSDDLQASQSPAEVERTCVRSDQHALLMAGSQATPVAMALIFSILTDAAPRRTAWLSTECAPAWERICHTRALESRGPPVA